MKMTRELQKQILIVVLAIAVGAAMYASGGGNDGASGNSVARIATGPEEDQITFCAAHTGILPAPGTYTKYDECIDYLKLVAQGLLDPDQTPPPGGPTETTQAVAEQATSTVPSNAVTGATPCPPATVDPTAQKKEVFQTPPPLCIDPTRSYTAVFDTSEGEIRVALDTRNTPITANNFIVLSRYKYYDDTRIFRTDPGLDIIQGGGMSNTSGPGYSLVDEGSGFTYEIGDLAMARTSAPNSAGGQWFFVTGPRAAGALNPQGTYVVFGRVTSGLGVAQRINSYDAGGAPNREIIVRSIRIIES